MVRRLGTVLGALLVVAVAALSVIVIGLRTKYPPVVNRIRRFNRDVGNPRQIESAGTPGASASILRHTGRKSGKEYATPVTATRTADGFVIALPYGPNTDWLKNVQATGSATMVHDGTTYQVDAPEVIPIAAASEHLAPAARRVLAVMGVDECLRLHEAH